MAAGQRKFGGAKKKIKCYNCSGNHYARNCKKEKKKDKRTEKSSHTLLCVRNESDAEDESPEDSVFLFDLNENIEMNDCVEIPDEKNESVDELELLDDTCNLSTFFVGEKKREWILDSGATAHMCNDEKNIENARPPQRKSVIVANNESIEIKCIGTIIENIKIDEKKSVIQIEEVQCIPDICANLLSISKLVKKNYCVIFDIKGAKIYNEQKK